MSKKTKVLIFDSAKQTITESSIASLEDCQKIVGGFIERAMTLPSGDELYCDEEGLVKERELGFEIYDHLAGGYYPVVGNAFLIGPVDSRGNNGDVLSTPEELKNITRFMRMVYVEDEE